MRSLTRQRRRPTILVTTRSPTWMPLGAVAVLLPKGNFRWSHRLEIWWDCCTASPTEASLWMHPTGKWRLSPEIWLPNSCAEPPQLGEKGIWLAMSASNMWYVIGLMGGWTKWTCQGDDPFRCARDGWRFVPPDSFVTAALLLLVSALVPVVL